MPRYSSEISEAPYAHVSKRTRSRFVMPRAARASATRRSSRSASSHSWNSSTVMFGCSPGQCSHETTRPSVSETTDLYACPSSRFQQTNTASRAIGSPGANPRNTSFTGSLSSMEAKRQRSLMSFSRRRMSAACRSSGAVSGSSGCRTAAGLSVLPGDCPISVLLRVPVLQQILFGGEHGCVVPERLPAEERRPPKLPDEHQDGAQQQQAYPDNEDGAHPEYRSAAAVGRVEGIDGRFEEEEREHYPAETREEALEREALQVREQLPAKVPHARKCRERVIEGDHQPERVDGVDKDVLAEECHYGVEDRRGHAGEKRRERRRPKSRVHVRETLRRRLVEGHGEHRPRRGQERGLQA